MKQIDLLQPMHHSVPEDWDFRMLANWEVPHWDLSALRYISPPTSLRIWNIYSGYADCMAMCQLVATQNLPQGRIITYAYTTQQPEAEPRIYLGITAPTICKITVQLGFPLNFWRKYRVTWWTTYDIQNQPSTRVLTEYWDTDHWAEISDSFHTALTGDTNRIAIGIRASGVAKAHHDDTEIWIPA